MQLTARRVARTLISMLTVALVALHSGSVAASAGQVSRGPTSDRVAIVGSVGVYEHELDDWVRQHEAATYQRLRRDTYESRRRALDALLADRLLTAEAGRRGVTREELVDLEAAKRVRAVTDADVASFLAANALPAGVTAAMIAPTVAALLRQRATDTARQEYLAALRQDPASAVQVWLEPPRVAGLRDTHNPTRGRVDAPVEVVVFSDFECPFCRRAEPVFARLVARFPDDIVLVWKHYPLSIHASARPAAEAAQCAHAQGRFWAFHDALFAEADAARLSPSGLDAAAVGVGLDPVVFARCVQTRVHQMEVMADGAAGERAGVSGTPTVFINGVAVVGSQPYDVYERLVIEELARVSRPATSVVSSEAAERGAR